MRSRKNRRKHEWASAAARRLQTLAGDAPTVPEAVQVIATRLLEGVRCPPADLEAVARRLNVTRIEAGDLPASGQLQRDRDGLKVVYSRDLSPARRRFTIAHELAHALFEATGPGCPRVGVELERLCDMIAAELLMPQQEFIARTGASSDISQLLKLARTFEVSRAAAAIRYAQLREVSVFELHTRLILWGYGIVKKGAARNADNALWPLMKRALTGESGRETIYLNHHSWSGKWDAEWMNNGEPSRALFLLKPLRSQRTVDSL